MCKPSSDSVCYQLHHQHYPLTKSDSTVLLDSVCETIVVHHSSSKNPRKRTFNDVLRTAVFCGACFAILIVGKHCNAFASPLVNLVHDIQSFDQLKKEFVDDELEVSGSLQRWHNWFWPLVVLIFCFYDYIRLVGIGNIYGNSKATYWVWKIASTDSHRLFIPKSHRWPTRMNHFVKLSWRHQI